MRLCEIPSPTGEERAVADAVLTELRDLGVEVVEDSAAEAARAGAGNLIARIAGERDEWVMFGCHLDTVPHDGPIEAVLSEGVYRSRGETILGADNKAAVTVLVELAAKYAHGPPPVGLEILFTVAEEDGLRGAKEVDPAIASLAVRLRARSREPDRRGDHRGPHLQTAGGGLPGHGGPLRHSPRGWAQRDRGGGRGNRRHEAGAPEPGDDRKRGRDLRRHGVERRPWALSR